MISGYIPGKKILEDTMTTQRPTRPLVYDYSDLRMRLPVRRADDALVDDTGMPNPLPHLRIW